MHHLKVQERVITEKGLGRFITALRASKNQKELHHCLTTQRAPSLSCDF